MDEVLVFESVPEPQIPKTPVESVPESRITEPPKIEPNNNALEIGDIVTIQNVNTILENGRPHGLHI